MPIDLIAEVAGDIAACIIDGRVDPPVIRAGTGVRNVVRESTGIYLMEVDSAPVLGVTTLAIEGNILQPQNWGYFKSAIVTASQFRITTAQSGGVIDTLFALRIRRYRA